MGEWERVVGQERAVALLRRAAERPVHSYLLVGARGSGVEDAARCFAAALVAPDDERTADLAIRGMHPDIVEFEPEGVVYRVKEDVRQRIIPEASRSPVEGSRKVIVIHEADRLQGTRGESANALLKTIEEPPQRTVIVLVTAFPEELPDTVRSRCQRVELAPLSEEVIRGALEQEGASSEEATLAARLAGGQLGRARALAGPLAGVRRAFVAVPYGLDDRTGTAVGLAEGLGETLREALAALGTRQDQESAELVAELDAAGYPERSRASLVNRLAERHTRAHRVARRGLIAEGIAALESVYRDALSADASRRNLDRPDLEVGPTDAAAALDACRLARESLERNPNEGLLLESLLVSLPPTARTSS